MAALFAIPKGWKEESSDSARVRRQLGNRMNYLWLQAPPKPYWGKWVVLGDGKVLGSGKSRPAAVKAFLARNVRPAALVVVPIGADGALLGLFTK